RFASIGSALPQSGPRAARRMLTIAPESSRSTSEPVRAAMPHPHEVLDLYRFQPVDNRFAHLSLQDLVEARDLYHMQLMTHANVVATALGRYRIRIDDSWPNERDHRKGTYPRRLDNSEVRPYSWPCVLVFVREWKEVDELEDPGQLVPKTLYMP